MANSFKIKKIKTIRDHYEIVIRSIGEGERQHLPKCPDNWRIVAYLRSEDKNEANPDVEDKMNIVHVYDVILDECPENQQITTKKVF